MATDANQAVAVDEEEHHHRHHHQNALPPGRKYVGTKESFAFIVYDISASFNIGKFGDLFTTDILRIGLNFQRFYGLVIGIWDIINDVFIAAMIDKTRTRFGKFKPYLVAYAVPGVAMSLFYWSMPILFKDAGLYDFSKLIVFFLFGFLNELAGTINGIARTGMLSTITPDVKDRTRLITQANLFSGFIEKVPEQIMGVMIDLINHNVVKIHMRTLYVTAGMITTIIGGLMALFFSIVAKERVMQSIDRPSIKDGVKSILTNKPILLLTLADFLGAFGINTGTNFYYVNVLKLATMTTIVGIPGAVISPLSYLYVPKAREKFSTKALWIAGAHTNDFLMLGVYLVGSFNKNYKKLGAMIPAFMLQETIFMCVYGIRKVIPEEMRNEAMDYCEWKNGFRTESMTGVARGLATKLVGTLGGFVKTTIMEKIGYDQMVKAGQQTERTERLLFTMCTIIPVVTGALGIIPKLFYDLTGEKRNKMYRELRARRAATAKAENEGLIETDAVIIDIPEE